MDILMVLQTVISVISLGVAVASLILDQRR
jgi:hypothetical protein